MRMEALTRVVRPFIPLGLQQQRSQSQRDDQMQKRVRIEFWRKDEVHADEENRNKCCGEERPLAMADWR
jgi:hypothetical protein